MVTFLLVSFTSVCSYTSTSRHWIKRDTHNKRVDNLVFISHSLVKIQYCLEPLWPRGSVLGVRPPGFRILCQEVSVIQFISPSSGGSSGPVWPIGGLKPHSFHFHCDSYQRNIIIIIKDQKHIRALNKIQHREFRHTKDVTIRTFWPFIW